MKKSLVVICFLVLSLVFIDQAQAFMGHEGTMGPYGGYCRGPRWGWYGAGKKVRTANEVRTLVAEYFRGTNLAVGEIVDKEYFFEVQILDPDDGEVRDILVIDKRNCRIRSKF